MDSPNSSASVHPSQTALPSACSSPGTSKGPHLESIHQQVDSFLGSSSVVIYTACPQPPFNHTFISANVQALVGYSPVSFLSEKEFWFKNIHPQDAPEIYSLLPQLFVQEHLEFEYRFRTSEGPCRWLRDEMRLKRDDSGRPIEIVGCWIDITRRKEAEQVRDSTESLFRSIFAQSPLAIKLYDHDGHLIDANPACLELLGIQTPGLLFSINFFSDPKLPANTKEDIKRGKTLRYVTELNLEAACTESGFSSLKEGLLHLECTVSPWQHPSLPESGYLVHVQDITHQKHVEEENTRLALVAQETNNMVVITDDKGLIQWVNPAFERRTGYKLPEVLGLKPGSFLRGPESDPEASHELREALREHRAVHAELINYTKTGEKYWIEVNIQPVKDSLGKLSHYIAIESDITARKNLEADLIKARETAVSANRAKSSFLASMSHEIRTPLNAILGFSQLLHRDPQVTPHQREQLDIISRSGEHLLTLLNDILELSKIEAGRITLHSEACDLHDLVESVTKLVSLRAKEKRLALHVEGVSALPSMVIADASKLRQMIINLLGNAIKFTSRGHVSLRLKHERLGEENIRLLVEIEDTGPGISKEEQRALFQHFTQTRTGRSSGSGSGLGLAITREFARLMSGDVEVSSVEGQGATFRFTIQLKVMPESLRPARSSSRKVTGLSQTNLPCRVLIIDNQPDGALLLQRILTPLGFDCRTVADIEGAIEMGTSWSPHLVLAEYRMVLPDDADLLKNMGTNQNEVPAKLLCFSSSALADEKAHALKTGSDAILAKPFREEELLEMISLLLGLEYVFEEQSSQTHSPFVPSSAQDLQGLAKLPLELRAELKAATLSANLDQIITLVSKVEALDPSLASELRHLAERFEYETLIQALNKSSAA